MTKTNVIKHVLAWTGTNVAAAVSLTIDAHSFTIKSFAPSSFISIGPCLRFLPLSQGKQLDNSLDSAHLTTAEHFQYTDYPALYQRLY